MRLHCCDFSVSCTKWSLWSWSVRAGRSHNNTKFNRLIHAHVPEGTPKHLCCRGSFTLSDATLEEGPRNESWRSLIIVTYSLYRTLIEFTVDSRQTQVPAPYLKALIPFPWLTQKGAQKADAEDCGISTSLLKPSAFSLLQSPRQHHAILTLLSQQDLLALTTTLSS